jgi:hypothetical protein
MKIKKIGKITGITIITISLVLLVFAAGCLQSKTTANDLSSQAQDTGTAVKTGTQSPTGTQNLVTIKANVN